MVLVIMPQGMQTQQLGKMALDVYETALWFTYAVYLMA